MDGTTTAQICLPRVELPPSGLNNARLALSKLGEARALAEEVASAAAATDVKPTLAQRKAGNYKKGKVAIHGLVVSVENPRGSYREGTAPDGSKWRTKMEHHYGAITGTTGRDGDAVDVFVGPDPDCELVFVVNQNDPATGRFDEHKVMLGFTTEADARAGYLACYEKGWKGLGSIKPMTLDDFKNRFLKGDLTKRAKEGDHARSEDAAAEGEPDREDPAGEGRPPAADGQRPARDARRPDDAGEQGGDSILAGLPDAADREPPAVAADGDRGRGRPGEGGEPGAEGGRAAVPGRVAGGGARPVGEEPADGPRPDRHDGDAGGPRPEAAGEVRGDEGGGRDPLPAGEREAREPAERADEGGGRGRWTDLLAGLVGPADERGGDGDPGDDHDADAADAARPAPGDGLQGRADRDDRAGQPGVADDAGVAGGGPADDPQAGQGEEAADRPAPRPKTVAVDLDGTLAEEYETFDPKVIGEPMPDVVAWLRKFKATGAVVIIWTVRGDDALVKAWADKHQIPYDYINENPHQPPDSSGKLVADVYLDNRAIRAEGTWDEFAPAVLEQLQEAA